MVTTAALTKHPWTLPVTVLQHPTSVFEDSRCFMEFPYASSFGEVCMRFGRGCECIQRQPLNKSIPWKNSVTVGPYSVTLPPPPKSLSPLCPCLHQERWFQELSGTYSLRTQSRETMGPDPESEVLVVKGKHPVISTKQFLQLILCVRDFQGEWQDLEFPIRSRLC